MKIRPKPRKYNNEDIDESYFATKSDENSRSRDEETPDGDQDKSEFFKTSKREFKIFDKKISEKNYASNKIRSFRYNTLNFIPLNLVHQLSKNLNVYFIFIMVL